MGSIVISCSPRFARVDVLAAHVVRTQLLVAALNSGAVVINSTRLKDTLL